MNVRRDHFLLPAIVLLTMVSGCGGVVITGGNKTQSSCSKSAVPSPTVSCPVRTPVVGVAVAGKVIAGSLPVSNASVQLYAAGISGNGSTPTELLPAPISTGTDGGFTIPDSYFCPSSETPVYLLSKGGQSGSDPVNSSRWLMAALGPCGTVNPGSTYVLDEATTVASVWALAPFMSRGGNVGSSCTNTTGLDNAFLTANNLVNARTGVSPGAGIPPTLAPPVNKLNSLANALVSCTSSIDGKSCSSLFGAATSNGKVPDNTVDAMLNVARSPGNNVAAIYSLVEGKAVYTPVLTGAPPDWMLYNTVSGGGMNLPASIGIAASGSVWVSSYFNAVSEFSPNGAVVFPAGMSGSGINQSYGMALDIHGNVWIANEQTTLNNGSGNVTQLSSSGQAVATGITAGGINFPIAVAADSNGNMWFANYGSSKVTLLSDSGAPISSAAGWGGTSLAYPVALAIDSNHNAWVANQGGTLPVTKISPDGSQVTNYDCQCNGASGVAIDRSDNVWIANYYGNSVSEVNACGTLLVGNATGGGLQHPQGIAVDGSGMVWVANYLGNSISKISDSANATAGNFLSPSSGFGIDAGLLGPYSLAIDASGSVWVSNSGRNTLTQFIGIAAPVKTPMAGPPQTP